MNRRLATSLFAAGAYSITLIAGQPVANAAAPGGADTTSAALFPATAALADGDDIRARFILTLQSDQLEQSALVPSLSPATEALADGDDIRARFILQSANFSTDLKAR